MAAPTTQFPKVGDTAPDFTLDSLGGRPVAISSYKGKKLVVFMWASW
ncbi:MAG: redoxin domain-containing protein [SAR202 cluster bacterium]|nr:redoxin domain-containing protein [SAR202 cluster bacterium]